MIVDILTPTQLDFTLNPKKMALTREEVFKASEAIFWNMALNHAEVYLKGRGYLNRIQRHLYKILSTFIIRLRICSIEKLHFDKRRVGV